VHAREHLQTLRTELGHTTSLWVLIEGEVLCLDQLCGHRRGQYAIDLGVGVGVRLPAHRTASGKALLAHLPDSELLELLAGPPLGGADSQAVTARSALRCELESIAAVGLALENEELFAGRRALAAVVLDEEGAAIGAIEVAVPAETLSRAQLLDELGPALRTVVDRVRSELQGARRGPDLKRSRRLPGGQPLRASS
jgi:DNA-binding IclR family transcriptional regulator